MKKLFDGIYDGKTVLVTGHTGFKGSWLCFWLKKMGANVIGYSLEAATEPNHFDLLKLDIISIIGDIRDQEKLHSVFKEYSPDIVFHLAAQALVRQSYTEPVETYETNVIGTLKVLEACRVQETKSIVIVTSDKAYENKEWHWGYRENDPMGGYDLYSSSKGCAELLVSSYRNSFFNLDDYGLKHNTLVASCRAGNVIGGGDWAEDRLIVDIMLAVSKQEIVKIRNPNAIRPWQHVLEPLSGYLQIGQKLMLGEKEFAEGWNFGPLESNSITVEGVVKNIKKIWNKINYKIEVDKSNPHEAVLLKLDCSKAHTVLNWKEVWDDKTTFATTTNWYKKYYENDEITTELDLKLFVNDAKDKDAGWAKF